MRVGHIENLTLHVVKDAHAHFLEISEKFEGLRLELVSRNLTLCQKKSVPGPSSAMSQGMAVSNNKADEKTAQKNRKRLMTLVKRPENTVCADCPHKSARIATRAGRL